MNNNCTDEQGNYPIPANEVVEQITSEECENLSNNTGLDGSEVSNCSDLTRMICDIKQEVDYLANQSIMSVAANEDSKCQPSLEPTVHSMMSRILRFSQAVECILCSYDPYIVKILTSGKYPQILMGSLDNNGYPVWVNPDTTPTENSEKPVTSGGIYQAVQDAILSVWHLWEEQPEFNYFAQTLNSSGDSHNLIAQSTDTHPSNGDRALVANDGTHGTSLYIYTNGEWLFEKELTKESDNLTNFATTHITSGYYKDKGVYYFDGTWQVLDADLSEVEKKLELLEQMVGKAVTSNDLNNYIITTRPTLAQANSVACNSDRDTIVLITG